MGCPVLPIHRAQLSSPGELVLPGCTVLTSELSISPSLCLQLGKSSWKGYSPLKQIETTLGFELKGACVYTHAPCKWLLRPHMDFLAQDYSQQLGISYHSGHLKTTRPHLPFPPESKNMIPRGKIATDMLLRTWHLPALLCFVRNTNHPSQIFMGHSNKKQSPCRQKSWAQSSRRGNLSQHKAFPWGWANQTGGEGS